MRLLNNRLTVCLISLSVLVFSLFFLFIGTARADITYWQQNLFDDTDKYSDDCLLWEVSADDAGAAFAAVVIRDYASNFYSGNSNLFPIRAGIASSACEPLTAFLGTGTTFSLTDICWNIYNASTTYIATHCLFQASGEVNATYHGSMTSADDPLYVDWGVSYHDFLFVMMVILFFVSLLPLMSIFAIFKYRS